ncbi:MAG: response regulator [Planctomycetales bacterium]|nr:response regulator [Planctomycetales bacterium]
MFHILLVEDDPSQAVMTARLLQRIRRPRFRVDTAACLTDAIECLRDNVYHAVLLDLGLPETEGFETLRCIREHDAQTPMIVLTALDDEETALQAFEHGAQDYLVKNTFNVESLGRCIRYAMQRQLLLTELHQVNQQNSHLLRCMPCILIGFDEQDRVTQWNKAAADLLQCPAELAIAQRLCDLKLPLATDDLERAIMMSRVMSKLVTGEEIDFVRPDGTQGRLEFRVAPMTCANEWMEQLHRQAHGNVATDLLLLATDVTESRRLKERLTQTQRLESLGQLAGGVAHEFNNLLQAIKGYTSLAMQELPEDAQAMDDLQQVVRAADRAAAITSQLLRFSRRDSIQRCNVDFNATIQMLAKMMRPLLGEGVELVLDLADEIGSIHADSGMLEQVLMNLCLNARDAMPHGGQLRIMTQRVLIDGDGTSCPAGIRPGFYAMLGVQDTGCGIPREVQRRVFEPFFTTKEVGKGTGLGLAAVYGVIQKHGGTIAFESEPGQGSTFKVLLPLASLPEGLPAFPDLTDCRAGHGETILIAEDDHFVRGSAVRILANAGYSVLVAKDGGEAIEMFDQHHQKIDLLLVDLMMPRRNGIEVWQHAVERKSTIATILCTGYSDGVAEQDLIVRAQLPVVDKPFDPEKLLQVVRETLDDRSTSRDAKVHAAWRPAAASVGLEATAFDETLAGQATVLGGTFI